MGTPNLRTRLFLSHIIVMLVGVTTLTVIGKFSSPRYFVLYLQMIEGRIVSIRQIRGDLMRAFELAWSRGAFLVDCLWCFGSGGD